MEISELSATLFEPLLDEAFILAAEGAGALTLIQVERKAPSSGAGRAPFSLLFSSDDANVLPQRVYELRHDSIGAVEIFLVPVEQTGGKTLYEAVFN